MRNVSLFSLPVIPASGTVALLSFGLDAFFSRCLCASPHLAVSLSGVSNSLSLTLTTALVSRLAITVQQHKLSGLNGGNAYTHTLSLCPRLQASSMKVLSGAASREDYGSDFLLISSVSGASVYF